MRVSRLTVVAALVAAGLLVIPLSAAAESRDDVLEATETFDYTPNLRPIGFSARPVPLDNFRPRSGNFKFRPRVLGRHGGPGYIQRLPPHMGARLSRDTGDRAGAAAAVGAGCGLAWRGGA